VATFTAVITLLMVVGTFTQFAVSTLGPFIVSELELTRAQFGTLAAAPFIVAGLLTRVVGNTVDHVRPRVAHVGVFLVVAAGLTGMGFAGSYPWILAATGFTGVGLAVVTPLTNRLVASLVVPRLQGLVLAIKQSGTHLGAMVAGATLPWLGGWIGWRVTLLVGVAVVLIMGLASTPRVPSDPAEERMGTLEEISRHRGAVRVLTLYAFLMASGTAAMNGYLPLYAHEQAGLSAPVAGALMAVVGGMTVLTRVLLGYLSDRGTETFRVLQILALGAAASVACIIAAGKLGPWILWPGAAAFGIGGSWNAVVMITIVKRLGSSNVGGSSGLVMTGFFAGFILSPPAFGFLIDATGTYSASLGMVLAAFASTGFGMGLWRRAMSRRPDE
jgi:predicted MFS family arabinose efflux permease